MFVSAPSTHEQIVQTVPPEDTDGTDNEVTCHICLRTTAIQVRLQDTQCPHVVCGLPGCIQELRKSWQEQQSRKVDTLADSSLADVNDGDVILTAPDDQARKVKQS